MPVSMGWLREAFAADGYIAGDELLVAVYLALRLEKPLLVEGAPGVGKTEIAKALARIHGAELIRLQCYEGLDEAKALYEWNYQRQLIHIQVAREQGLAVVERDLFSEEYLLERPLLKAIRAPERPVLLIDECDKTDEEFEAFLFEVLSDFQVSIPELGTVPCRQVPVVVLTSNAERELSDGLRRRCIYLYIDFPDVAKETRIIQSRLPEAGERLAAEAAAVIGLLRAELQLKKRPSIAETLDWVRALTALDVAKLDDVTVARTANVFLKNRDDIDQVRSKAPGLVAKARERAKLPRE